MLYQLHKLSSGQLRLRRAPDCRSLQRTVQCWLLVCGGLYQPHAECMPCGHLWLHLGPNFLRVHWPMHGGVLWKQCVADCSHVQWSMSLWNLGGSRGDQFFVQPMQCWVLRLERQRAHGLFMRWQMQCRLLLPGRLLL